MGFSTIAAFTLLFIASLIVFSSIIIVTTSELKELNKIIKIKKKDYIDLRNSNFNIVKVLAKNTSETTYRLEIIIYNTGSTTFTCSKFTILVDGIITNFTCNISKLYPLQYARFYIDNLNGTVGSVHRLKIVSENGIQRVTKFTVQEAS